MARQILHQQLVKALKAYRCQFSVDDYGNGIGLVDKLCPYEAYVLTEGQAELDLLADYISAELNFEALDKLFDHAINKLIEGGGVNGH